MRVQPVKDAATTGGLGPTLSIVVPVVGGLHRRHGRWSGSDVVGHERRIELVPRENNANGARGKGRRGSVPVTGELVRASDYMHVEYGELDCDYVFINLWAGRVGRPMTYANVVDIIARTRWRVGFSLHRLSVSHTYATLARRGGVPIEVVSKLLTHSSVQTASGIYVHTSVEDLRAELERAGWLPAAATMP